MNKTIIFSSIFFGLIVYVVIGIYTLSTSLETINGAKGTIWTQMQSGFEKLDAIEAQLKFSYKDRKDIIQIIAEARTGYTNAKELGNLDQAVRAATTTANNLKILIEIY